MRLTGISRVRTAVHRVPTRSPRRVRADRQGRWRGPVCVVRQTIQGVPGASTRSRSRRAATGGVWRCPAAERSVGEGGDGGWAPASKDDRAQPWRVSRRPSGPSCCACSAIGWASRISRIASGRQAGTGRKVVPPAGQVKAPRHAPHSCEGFWYSERCQCGRALYGTCQELCPTRKRRAGVIGVAESPRSGSRRAMGTPAPLPLIISGRFSSGPRLTTVVPRSVETRPHRESRTPQCPASE